MAYEVPQYIEIENKLIGPLTLRQFLYLLIGTVVIFLLYFFLVFWLWFVVSIPIALLAMVFAFYKPHGRRFDKVFVSALSWFVNPRYYFWQKREKMREIDLEVLEKGKKVEKPEAKEKVYNLKEIAKMLDKGK